MAGAETIAALGLAKSAGAVTTGSIIAFNSMMLGTLMSGIGAVAGAANQKAGYESQSRAAEYNATVSKQNQDAARAHAAVKEDQVRRKAALVLGEQRAAIAQSGLGASGSMLDIYDESEINAEMDALNVRYEGEMTARGYGNQVNLENYQASSAKSNAGRAMTGGYLGLAGSLLGGIGNTTNMMSRTSRQTSTEGVGNAY